MKGGGCRHQDHGFHALFLQILVCIAQQLAGVALALDVRIGGQGVDVAHRDLTAVGELQSGREHGCHGVDLTVVLYH